MILWNNKCRKEKENNETPVPEKVTGEKWKEVYRGEIPVDTYCAQLENGEENGLVIKLEVHNNLIILDFGCVLAVRMIDEGALLNDGIYDENELNEFGENAYKNVIYEVEGGEFKKQMGEVSGDKEFDRLYTHYLIVTLNYFIEIITFGEISIKKI